MEFKILVSKEKNLERLEKLTDDPAFVVSLLKIKGYEKCPEEPISLKLGLVTKKDTKKD